MAAGRPANTERMLTATQVANRLGCHPETIRRAYRKGELKARRNRLAPGAPLLFAESAVNEFARARTE